MLLLLFPLLALGAVAESEGVLVVERRPNGQGARQRGLSYRAGGPQDWSVWARRGRVGHDPTCAEPSVLIVLGVIAARFGSNMAKFRLRWRASELSLVQAGGGFGRCVGIALGRIITHVSVKRLG
jgi:hypothetical protein